MNFENLEIWKRSLSLSIEIYKHFANSNDFGFKDQITRSSLSISSNIAEGCERDSQKDLIRFIRYSKGSCGELRTQIYIGINIGYISKNIGDLWFKESKELLSMLAGFIKSVENNLDTSN